MLHSTNQCYRVCYTAPISGTTTGNATHVMDAERRTLSESNTYTCLYRSVDNTLIEHPTIPRVWDLGLLLAISFPQTRATPSTCNLQTNSSRTYKNKTAPRKDVSTRCWPVTPNPSCSHGTPHLAPLLATPWLHRISREMFNGL